MELKRPAAQTYDAQLKRRPERHGKAAEKFLKFIVEEVIHHHKAIAADSLTRKAAPDR